jgi:hypothetical protein
VPKFYVESGPLRLVFDADDAECAAMKAIQWNCDRRSVMEVPPQLEVDEATSVDEGELSDRILVSERGFGNSSAEVFDTLEIVAAWQALAFPWD